jgi:hypothetical protein
MIVVVLTCDKYLRLLRGFQYLFSRYWSSLQDVLICGFNPPDFDLPANFRFFSIDSTEYPVNKWSDALIAVCGALADEHFILLLDDYWLCRTVDVRGVAAACDYIRERPEVLRFDLTADRLYAGGMFDVESYGSYDIIETPAGTPYQFSTQAGIWNRRMLLSLLKPGMTGWEVEVQTAPGPEMRVLGSRQYLVRYANAMLKGKADESQLKLIPAEHREFLQMKGWMP